MDRCARAMTRDDATRDVGDESSAGTAATAEPRAAARTIDDDDDAGRD